MSCFLKYYYKLRNCQTLAESWVIDTSTNLYGHANLRQVEIGCFVIDQLTGNCYEFLELTSTEPLVVGSVLTTPCHVYNTCAECLAVSANLGCVNQLLCNYDSCATAPETDPTSSDYCDSTISIGLTIDSCPGEINLCTNVNC